MTMLIRVTAGLLLCASSSFASSTIIIPRVALVGEWKTQIAVRSLTSTPDQARIEVFDELGVAQESEVLPLPVNYAIRKNVSGWARITSLSGADIDGSAIIENTTTGNRFHVLSVDTQSRAVIPLPGDNQTALVLLNPGEAELNPSLLLYGRDGSIDQTTVTLGPRQQIANFIDDLFPSARTGGQVVVSLPSTISHKFAIAVLETTASGEFFTANIPAKGLTGTGGPAGTAPALPKGDSGAIITFGGTNIPPANTHYMGNFGSVYNSLLSAGSIMPIACTVDALAVSGFIYAAVGVPAAGWTYTFTLFKNAVPTPVSCSFTWGTTFESRATCTVATKSATFAPGDLWALEAKTKQVGTPPWGNITASMRCR